MTEESEVSSTLGNGKFALVGTDGSALCRYSEDGDLAIDCNEAERSLRGVLVGRQRWLFFGSEGGGDMVAVLRNLIVSCQQAGVAPSSCLPDGLRRMADFPLQRIAELLPVHWKPASA